MKRNDHFILRELGGTPYLLPYGQTHQEFRRSCRLNETGVFLWNLLAQERSADDLTAECARHFDIAADDLPELAKDVEQFIDELGKKGCLAEHSAHPPFEESMVRTFCAGSMVIRLEGEPQAFPKYFDSFYCNAPDKADQTILIRPFSHSTRANGNVLLRCSELTVMDSGDRFVLLFPSMDCIEEAHLDKDASHVNFYCHPPYTDTLREELFHAIRIPFLYLAQRHHMAVLHSASLLYRGKAWLFSAPSGTGKSTHAGLWEELTHAPQLNGDLNLMALADGQPLIHGIPWCGTSGICDTDTYPLGGIILLKQAREDHVEELSPDARKLLVLQRLISPFWTPEMLDCNLRLVDDLASRIYIARLHCTKKPSAVTAIKEDIDRYLAQNR